MSRIAPAAILTLVLSGCGDSDPGTSASKPRRGGFVRVFNLTPFDVESKVSGRTLTSVLQPFATRSFQLVPPGKTTFVVSVSTKPDKSASVETDVAGNQTLTLYVLADKEGIDVVPIRDDPNQGPSNGARVRFANFLKDPADFDLSTAAGAKVGTYPVPGGASAEPVEVQAGSVRVSVRSKAGRCFIESQLVPGGAYSVVVAPDKGRPKVIVVHNNPPMEGSITGASPVG